MRNPLRRPKAKLSASKQKLLESMKVETGGHQLRRVEKGKKVPVCVMELISVMQHGVVTASPPCVSATIRDLMINRNDSTYDDDERQKLKKLAPDVLHTAPMRYLSADEARMWARNEMAEADQRHYMFIETDVEDQKYRALEVDRRKRVDAWHAKVYPKNVASIPFQDFAKFVRELAGMGRFPARPRGKKPPVAA